MEPGAKGALPDDASGIVQRDDVEDGPTMARTASASLAMVATPQDVLTTSPEF